MATIDRRLTDLEQARAGHLGPLVLTVHEDLRTGERAQLTAGQDRQVDEAHRAGRIVVLVRKFFRPAAEQEAQ